MGQLTVRQWAIAGLSTGAALIIALAGFSWNFAKESLSAASFVNHTYQVIGEVAVLRTPAEVDANDAGAELDLSAEERAKIDEILAGAAGRVREFTPLRPAMEPWGEELSAR